MYSIQGIDVTESIVKHIKEMSRFEQSHKNKVINCWAASLLTMVPIYKSTLEPERDDDVMLYATVHMFARVHENLLKTIPWGGVDAYLADAINYANSIDKYEFRDYMLAEFDSDETQEFIEYYLEHNNGFLDPEFERSMNALNYRNLRAAQILDKDLDYDIWLLSKDL